MHALMIIHYVLLCFFLILVVLLQQGKGADVAAAFGGSGAQASFGPRGTTTLMHKITVGSFVVFVLLCMGLSVMTARTGRSVTSEIKGKAPAGAPAAPAQSQPKPADQAPAPAGSAAKPGGGAPAQPAAPPSSQPAPAKPAAPSKQ